MEVNVPETVRVDGVVVQVNEQLDYAYVHTVGLGRALISPLLKIEDVKVGAWLSLTVTQNDNFAPVSRPIVLRPFLFCTTQKQIAVV
ncbi:unnamed protein product [Toxocara canis]|uniref:S1 motif domain-containing protein n=1 Tax=Toxocara canis TaxID=6265 RepID=A0A183UN02_TOXCA|nr:unnamed protein product [Toxocara canis]